MTASTPIEQLLRASVLPILVTKDNAPDRNGSCVLVRMLGLPFLVTAGHVIVGTKGQPIYVAADGARAIEIGGVNAFHTRDDDDDLDIGLIPLTESHTSLLSAFTFIPEGAIERGTANADSYAVFGFPESNSQFRVERPRRNIRQNSFDLRTGPAAAAIVSRLGLNADRHLALAFDPDGITMNGEKYNPPNPKGISGGGAFAVRGDGGVKLAAIMTDHKKADRVMVGVRMSMVLAFARSVIGMV